MFLKWGYVAYRFRRIIPVIFIGLIVALFVGFGIRLEDRLSQEGWEDPNASSTTAAQIEQEVFARDNSGDVILLFSSDGGVQEGPEFDAAYRHLEQLGAEHPEQIAHITSYFDTRSPEMITDDGTTAFAAIGLEGDDEQTLQDFRAIEDFLVPAELPDGMSVEVAGATAVADALDDGMSDDISRAEQIGLPFVALLLLVVFGSVMAAFMPLIIGVLSIMGALGILSILAGTLQVNVFSQAVVTLLGLGLAIDYGLFMVSRFREEMDKDEPIGRAVAITTATAGKTVVFSAFMVMVALSGLLLFPQAFLKSVSYGAIAAVGLAALLSVTILPALFGMLGKNIDKFAIRKTSRRGRRIEDTFWYRIPAWAMKHSKKMTVLIVGGLMLLMLPIVNISFGGINETYLPPAHETRQAQDTFNEEFPEFRTEPIKLVVTNADNSQLVDVVMQTREVEGLTGPMTAGQSIAGTTVLSAGIVDRDDNQDVIEQLRAIEAPAGVDLYIGGTPAMEVESLEALFERLPWMALYLVVATFILMMLVFGSMVQPAKAIIMTALGMGATLGILTLMFVQGYGCDLLGFSPGPLMSPVVVLIVAIIYGLSTDYEVFLVSRMVEARDRGRSTDEAIKLGTARTGTIITAAALIMIVVAAAFALSDIVMMKYIAFGMIFALAIDATVIRMLLVPSVMHLLREDNWWAPGPIKRLYHRIGHGSEEQLDDEHAPVVTPSPEPAEATAARGSRDTRHNDELIPFQELRDRLQRDRDAGQ
ncbi:RND transporter [Corynebacterium yudongzhengii]|uniref:MMPL family transporter n=1 Tax=Corynebacterium yudongzhengii TaxID=2080740 RepID=A0A2U1T840_9CORY|nr:MMPL family transporter [Corynebacterium yudongzhengii]AWB82774.1 RND transporter [Corynebacterium yudongzhengii]PWC02166.1 MMPL family transporter [Corynebacterium yudongzhengii]